MTNDSGLPAAVLWDLDGTIVDTETYWIAAEHRIVEEHGGTWTNAHAEHLIGKDLRYSAHYLRKHGNVTKPVEEIVHTIQNDVVRSISANPIPWRPGARELIEGLHVLRMPQALVTMSWSAMATAILAHLPDGLFDVVVTGDRVSKGKPDPEPYLLGLQELGVEASEAIIIEDSLTGLASAVASGAHVIVVPHLQPVEPGPYRIVDSLTNLTPDTLLEE